MQKDFLSPLNDYVVKSIFGDQKNIENTKALLKPILGIPPAEFGKLTIVDPFLKRFWRKDKLGIVDIKLTTTTGRVVNIEVQVERYKFFIQRIIYYLAKMLVEQMKSGFDYGTINQTICVVIANHTLLPDEVTYLNHYDLRNPLTGRLFTDLLKVVMIELPKVPEADDGQAIWPWLKFFKCKTQEDLTMLTKAHAEIKPAVTEYAKITWSDRRRMIADYKEKARRDKYAMMEFAKDEGIAIGRNEGITIGRDEGITIGEAKGEAKGLERLRDTARKMKARGIPASQIAEDTGLPAEEVERL